MGSYPDIFGFGLGTPEEEQQDPIGALAQEKAKRQALLEQQRKKFEEENARQRAQADHIAAADLGRKQTQGQASGNSNPYLGFIPRDSPAGEAVGTAQDIGRVAQDFRRNVSPLGLASDLFSKSGEFANWALSPRAPKSIATPQPRPIPTPRPQTQPPPADAYGRTGELDQMEAAYNQRLEHPALSFSLGAGKNRGPEMTYDPLKPNGGIPDVGAPGRGGFTDQPAPLTNKSSFDDWRSRVANPAMFSGAMEALEMPGIEAEQARNKALAQDPFLLETYQGRQKLQEKALGLEDERGREQEYRQAVTQNAIARMRILDKLHAKPEWKTMTPQQQAEEEAKASAPFDHQDKVLDFAFSKGHGTRDGKAGLGLGG